MTCIVLHTVYYQCTYIAHFGAQQRRCQRETTTDTTGRWFFAICFLKGSLDSLCTYLCFSYALLPFPPGASQSISTTHATVTSATSPSPTIFVSTCASSATAPASYGSNQVAGRCSEIFPIAKRCSTNVPELMCRCSNSLPEIPLQERNLYSGMDWCRPSQDFHQEGRRTPSGRELWSIAGRRKIQICRSWDERRLGAMKNLGVFFLPGPFLLESI